MSTPPHSEGRRVLPLTQHQCSGGDLSQVLDIKSEHGQKGYFPIEVPDNVGVGGRGVLKLAEQKKPHLA